MIMDLKELGFVTAIFLFLPGCATYTLADALAARGSGVSQEFEVPIERVWNVLPVVISELGLDLVTENREKGYILAQRGLTILSYGENVAIFPQVISQNRTRVEVVTKRAVGRNIFATDWSDDILKRLNERV